MKHLVLAFLLSGAAASAQTLVEVKDILPGPPASNPLGFVYYNGYTYFQATTGAGEELWRTDGTASGTQLFMDIRPGANGSVPEILTVAGNTLYFFADDSLHGKELWKSDGTTAGTSMVKDIYPGPASSTMAFSYNAFIFHNQFFFSADDGIHGQELWKSDGTASSTAIVKDIFQGQSSSHPYGALINTAGDKFYISADDSVHGMELWVSDGTAAGTTLAVDLEPGVLGSYSNAVCNYHGKIYLTAYSAIYGQELFSTDGTFAGTSLLKDINSGPGDSYASDVMVVNDRMVFAADDGIHDRELWASDGTSAGTKMIADIDSSSLAAAGSAPSRFCVNGERIFFTAFDSAFGYEPWITDGTAAGTHLIVEIRPGPSSAIAGWAEGFISVGNRVFFKASEDADGTEFWESDGTAAGTKMVLPQFIPGAGHGDPGYYALCGTTIYMQGKNATDGLELWKIGNVISGIADERQPQFQLYPNPASGAVNIASEDGATVSIRDLSGRELWSATETSAFNKKIQLPAAAGVYLVELQNEKGRVTKKIVVE